MNININTFLRYFVRVTAMALVLVFFCEGVPVAQAQSAPAGLSTKGKAAWVKYQKRAGDKAFAMSSNGTFAWRTGQSTVNGAAKWALDNCKKFSSRPGSCKIISVNGSPLGLSIKGQNGWIKYQKRGTHKAFAMSSNGAFGYTWDRSTVAGAKQGALEHCPGSCWIVSVNGKRWIDSKVDPLGGDH